MISAVARPDKT